MDEQQFEEICYGLYELCIDHKGKEPSYHDFKKAQQLIIESILSLEADINNLKTTNTSQEIIREKLSQISLIKDFANTIAWKILGEEESTIRAYNGAGPDNGRLEDKNIQSSLDIIKYFEPRTKGFVLLTDITTSINIGDLLVVGNGPPRTIEMKEGDVNKQLIDALGNEAKTQVYLNNLDDKKRISVQKQIARLERQSRRLSSIDSYIKDDSMRYDEYLDANVHVFKHSLTFQTYSNRIQNTFDKLELGDIKTIKVHGGLYVLISRKPPNDDDILYFKHKMYHIIHQHTRNDCGVYNKKMTQADSKQEIKGLLAVNVRVGMQGIGNYGYKPATASLSGFSPQLAKELLSKKTNLYFYLDMQEFLSVMRAKGLRPNLVKGINHLRGSNGLLTYQGKNISLGEGARLTIGFVERIYANYSTPLTEINRISKIQSYYENMSEADFQKFAKKLP